MTRLIRALIWVSLFALGAAVGHTQGQAGADGWQPLFNGKNLEGWTPKITGYPLGENFGETFRVADGVLRVAYDKYDNFGGRFGHLFYKTPFSDYLLRVEYRFVGTQVAGGPDWAFRNSGVMIHCQPPETMGLDQKFPVSIEVQFLGGKGAGDRTTANVCTPGTHVVIGGQLVKQHCTNSTSRTYHGDEWVTAEIEVRGNQVIRHTVDGRAVLEYSRPQLDDQDPDAQALLKNGADRTVSGGYISLQSESHPVEFRKVELKRLDAPAGRRTRLTGSPRAGSSGG
jgi:hypothetical protein